MVERIPIFPLGLVLYPGAPLPLHIFEPRYKEMIDECLALKSDFGMICAFPIEGPSTKLAQVGCSARITAVLNRYDDGRLDILAEGMKRFRVRHVIKQRSFQEADVEWLQDDPATTRSMQLRVTDLHNQLLLHAFEEGSSVDLRVPTDAERMAFVLAAMLPFDLAVKQAVLERDSEEHRLEVLATAYESLIRRASEIEIDEDMDEAPKRVM